MSPMCGHCQQRDKEFASLKDANTGAWQYRNKYGHWVDCPTQTEVGRQKAVSQRLLEIKERCEKATPGPWYSVRDDLDVHPNICADDKNGSPIMVAQIRLGLPKDMGSEEANESFILSSRQDIPYLLEALKEMERQRNEYKKCADEFDDAIKELMAKKEEKK